MSLPCRHFPLRAATVGAAATLLLAAASSARAQSAGDEEREAPEVNKLVFRGVRAVDKDELRKSIDTQHSTCRGMLFRIFCAFSDSRLFVDKHYLDRAEFRRDVFRIRVFYWRRGYREAQVDTAITSKGDGVQVTFTIREGPPVVVGSLTVEGATEILSRSEALGIPLRAGEPLDLIELDSSTVALRNKLWDKGYADAEVKDTVAVDAERRVSSVRITVDPKWKTTVGSITVSGNEHISERTILNSLEMEPGHIYRRRDLIASQRNLYESNLFRQAVIIVPPKGDSVKEIEVTVQEAPLNEARTSLGFNTVDFLQTEGRYTRYNFLGGARRLDVRAVVGNLLAPQLNGALFFQHVTDEPAYLRPTWQASLDFTQPWFRSPKNTVAASVFAHRRSAPSVFIDNGFGTSGTFTREMAARATASLNYRFELTEVQAGDIYFCQYYGVCDITTITALQRRHRLSPLAITTTTDRTNDIFFPTTGYFARLDAEHASHVTLSDFRYNRVAGDASKYFLVGRRRVIAARVRGGWVQGLRGTNRALGVPADTGEEVLHPRKQFYAGGSQSVRGYGENQLGPRVLTVDPSRLLDTNRTVACDTASLVSGACDPNDPANNMRLRSADFQPRPLGGTSLIEASVEYRFPLWRQLGGAVFVDGALVGEGGLGRISKGTGAITPGFGARYYSPAGAIRVDLGIRPTLVERLPVVTEVIENGERKIVTLRTLRTYDPLDGASGIRQVLNRLTLHLSIGQAF
jgi:outer membrane protein insertion porin family